MQEDTRNLLDEYKGLSNEEIFERLEQKRSGLEVAIENVAHDFNAGTIVRNANNFNARAVHIIGKRKYNRRGAMCTDKYLSIYYHETVRDFLRSQEGREVAAIENNVPGVRPLSSHKFSERTTLVFGSEGEGISEELLVRCDKILEIPGYGSTRSVNVGVASGIAMYEWAKQILGEKK